MQLHLVQHPVKDKLWVRWRRNRQTLVVGWLYFVGCIKLMSLMSISGDSSRWNYGADCNVTNSCTNKIPFSTVASHFLSVQFIGSCEFLRESTSRLQLLSMARILGKQL